MTVSYFLSRYQPLSLSLFAVHTMFDNWPSHLELTLNPKTLKGTSCQWSHMIRNLRFAPKADVFTRNFTTQTSISDGSNDHLIYDDHEDFPGHFSRQSSSVSTYEPSPPPFCTLGSRNSAYHDDDSSNSVRRMPIPPAYLKILAPLPLYHYPKHLFSHLFLFFLNSFNWIASYVNLFENIQMNYSTPFLFNTTPFSVWFSTSLYLVNESSEWMLLFFSLVKIIAYVL